MKNINLVNKVIAKNLNKPLNVVAAVNASYWKESHRKLVEGEVTTIFWKHLGSITISKYKVYKEIKRLIKRIRFIRTEENSQSVAKLKTVESIKNRLRQLLRHRNNIAIDEYNKRISGISLEGIEGAISHFESDTDED